MATMPINPMTLLFFLSVMSFFVKNSLILYSLNAITIYTSCVLKGANLINYLLYNGLSAYDSYNPCGIFPTDVEKIHINDCRSGVR